MAEDLDCLTKLIDDCRVVLRTESLDARARGDVVKFGLTIREAENLDRIAIRVDRLKAARSTPQPRDEAVGLTVEQIGIEEYVKSLAADLFRTSSRLHFRPFFRYRKVK